ncbi:MAG: CRISPR-associated CARF protein Csa3 [Nitrososphaeria archaeon]
MSSGTAYVFPLGYDISGIVKVITDLHDEGSVVLVLPQDLDSRARSSLDSLRAFISGLNARGSRYEIEEVKVTFDPQRDISALIGALSSFGTRRFYITGGMRYLALLVYYAASFFESPASVLVEENSSMLTFPPLPARRLKAAQMAVLRELMEGPMSVRQLSQRLGRSQAALSRTISVLLGMQAVSRDGRLYRITELGKAITGLQELQAD